MSKSSRSFRQQPATPASLGASLCSPAVLQMLEIGEQVGTFGPESAWKIYEASRRLDQEAVSVFVFEKRTAEKLHKPKRKGTITELYKRGFKQLERVQQLRFLKVLIPIEETTDALVIITEPVIGSLADVIGREKRTTTFPKLCTSDKLLECPLLDLEIKCGLIQITEALIHLHSTEHSMHGNVCPETILVAANGSWKLAGLEFAEKSPNRVDSFPSIRWSSKYPKLGQPNLNYIAPEVQMDSHCSTTSDMFSLGMTICAIYNHGKSLLECDHSATVYEQQLSQLSFRSHEFIVQMPSFLQEAVEALLHRDPTTRPTAQLFSLTKYFNDPALSCLRRLDYIEQMFPSQKAEFYPALRDALHSIPRKLWLSRVLPALAKDLANHDFAPYALYPLSYMIEHSDKLDYVELFRPCIQHIFDMPDKPPETHVILLRNLSSFAKIAHPDEIQRDLIPILNLALESTDFDVLEAGVHCFSKFYPVIRNDVTKLQLFQSLKRLFHQGTNHCIKVHTAVIWSLEKIVDHLTKGFVLDEVLPVLADERLSYTVDSVDALIEFYRHVCKDGRFSLNPEHITKYVLPTILPLLTHPDLSKEQYTSLETFAKDLFCQVEKKQRSKYKLDVIPFGSIHVPPSSQKLEAGTSSASNSRRGSMTNATDMASVKSMLNGGPHIVFTTGDGSGHSSRSSSPSHSSRRSSYAPNERERGERGRGGSTMYLNVDEGGGGSRSRTSPTTPERRGSFLSFQGLPAGLNANQRRHSAVSIQSISSQMVSLFAGRT